MKNSIYQHPALDKPGQRNGVRAGSHSSIYMAPLPAILGITFVIACAAAVSTELQAFADGEVVGQVSASCTLTSVTGTYKALSSDYSLAGSCSVNETSGGQTSTVPFYAINWTATASHQPNTKATFETMIITLREDGRVTSVGTVNSTMQCGTDPWRVAPSGLCRQVTRKTTPPSFPGYLSMAYQQLLQDAPGLPLSFSLSPAQRAALHKQYQIAMATRQKVDPSQSTLSRPQGPGVSPFRPGGPHTSDAILKSSNTVIINLSVPLTISNLTVASGKQYLVPPSGLQIGGLPYIDRSFTFTILPPVVQGQAYIQTANNDKTSTTATFLSFTVNQPVSVYVAYDVRIAPKPPWLSAFSDTGTNMVTSDTTLRLFVRSFPAGPITLGGNTSNGGSMYSVVVKPSQTQTMSGQSSGGQASSMLTKPSAPISSPLRGSTVPQSRIFRRGIDQKESGLAPSESVEPVEPTEKP